MNDAGPPPADAAARDLDRLRGDLGAGAAALDEAKIRSIERWLADPVCASDRDALLEWVHAAAQGDAAALAELGDAFRGPLPIGTGGRRGRCGPGPNRVNAAVMQQTAAGLVTAMGQPAWHAGADDIEAAARGPFSVAIAYDTRHRSRWFAHVVARRLLAGGCRIRLLDAPRPTPQLSFEVRRHGCTAGIVISASHNPPSDNGIKIYGPDGAQVLAARDRTLMGGIEAAAQAGDPDAVVADPAAPDSVIVEPGEDPSRIEVLRGDALAAADGEYHQWVRGQGVAQARHGAQWGQGLTAVFTPLHGVGHSAVVPVLDGTGVALHPVEAQCDPDDGRFSTVESANPEVPASMAMARTLADEVGASLVLATDPDADRLGALARQAGGDLVPLDGNQLAVLMADHVLRHIEPAATDWMLTTVVSTRLLGKLGRAHGVEVVEDLLVGFKHHAGMMAEQPQRSVVFMFEEAHGYMRGDDVHDKDGAVAARLLAECAALAHRQGRTLFDELARIWIEHGYHRERTENLWAHGAAGREAIAAAVEDFRSRPPQSLGGLPVVSVVDRTAGQSTGSPTRDLPGNVLVYELAEGARACRLVVRPSGTEPKAKIYALASADPTPQLDAARAAVDGVVDAVLADAKSRATEVMAPILEAGTAAT